MNSGVGQQDGQGDHPNFRAVHVAGVDKPFTMKHVHENCLSTGMGISSMNDHLKVASWMKQAKKDVVYNSNSVR
jgi:hypothetical protein